MECEGKWTLLRGVQMFSFCCCFSWECHWAGTAAGAMSSDSLPNGWITMFTSRRNWELGQADQEMSPGYIQTDRRWLPEESLQPVRAPKQEAFVIFQMHTLYWGGCSQALSLFLSALEQETSVEGRIHSHLHAGGGWHGVRGQSGRQQGELCFREHLSTVALCSKQTCQFGMCMFLQAVLCRMEETEVADGQRRSVTLALSKEHNPTIYEERMRIQRAGGTVRYLKFCSMKMKRTPEAESCSAAGSLRFQLWVFISEEGLWTETLNKKEIRKWDSVQEFLLIIVMKSHASILPTSSPKHFQSVFFFFFLSFLLVVTKLENSCCILPLKASEDDTEEIQKWTVSEADN